MLIEYLLRTVSTGNLVTSGIKVFSRTRDVTDSTSHRWVEFRFCTSNARRGL